MTESGPVVAYETLDSTEAECIRQALESSDIFCRLVNVNANRMIGLGGSVEIQILVPAELAIKAKQIIKDFLNTK